MSVPRGLGFSLVLLCLALVPAGSGTAGSSSALSTAPLLLAAGDSHACAQTHSRALVCWGWNKYGQLGDGTTRSRRIPVAVHGLGTGIAAIAAGFGHTCAVTATARVECWGENRYGQLGDGTTIARHTPVFVAGLKGVAAIAAGDVETCALTTAGRVKCWGSNEYGQLGDRTTTDRHKPVAVFGLGTGNVAIAVGGNHACAITGSHGVKCWGKGDEGALGNGSFSDSHQPVPVVGLASGVTGFAAGFEHTCAWKSNGDVLCWGGNSSGQLGTGTVTNANTPTVTAFHAARSVAGGWGHTCAAESIGTVEAFQCVGLGDHGELGNNMRTSSSLPVYVYALTSKGKSTLTIGSSAQSTCVRVAGGAVFCWGDNLQGELGDGTRLDRYAPTPVKVLDCVVPKVVGKPYTVANNRILAASCAVGKLTFVRSTKKIGTVLKQKPRAGSVFEAGRKVNLVLSRGPV